MRHVLETPAALTVRQLHAADRRAADAERQRDTALRALAALVRHELSWYPPYTLDARTSRGVDVDVENAIRVLLDAGRIVRDREDGLGVYRWTKT